MQNQILIGTGFYAGPENIIELGEFLSLWRANTARVSDNIVIADNSEGFCTNAEAYLPNCRHVRIWNNLGHAGDPISQTASTPLLGWSMSWMIPALIAYSEKCDFIYKEQDCLAFGDWLPIVRQGAATIGRNDVMPCEQSLFYIRHDYILTFVRNYLCLGEHDAVMSTEEKFRRVMEQSGGMVQFHDLPGGRNRPLPDLTKPFYLQRITPDEMQTLKNANLI